MDSIDVLQLGEVSGSRLRIRVGEEVVILINPSLFWKRLGDTRWDNTFKLRVRSP